MNLTVNGQVALFGLSRNEFSPMMAPHPLQVRCLYILPFVLLEAREHKPGEFVFKSL